MELRDLIRVAKRWVPIALIVALTLAIASYAFTKFTVKKVYTATVTMEVQAGVTGQSVPDPTISNLIVPTEAQVAAQGPTVDQAMRRVQSTPGIAITPGEIAAIKASIQCKPNPDTSLFSCSASAHQAEVAALVANQLATVFTQGEQAFDQQRYQTVLTNIRSSEAIARKNGDAALLSRLQGSEISVLVDAAQRASIVRITQQAQRPTSPSSPHPTLNAALAFLAALLLVLGVGFVSDRLDDSVRGEEEIKELTGLPLLGIVPSIDMLKDRALSPNSLLFFTGKRSPEAESFRVVRTGIAFSRIDDPPRCLLVTSTVQAEGKSTFASNLACAFAESGKSVILVDLDLRRPSLSKIVNTPMRGLTNVLLDQASSLESYLVAGALPNLRVLPSGPTPPSPAELISSLRMAQVIQRLQTMADIIIIDSPPILAAADAAITAGLCDSAVLLVRPDRITRRGLTRAVETLNGVGVRVIGMVVNGVPRTDADYYGYGNYYDYQAPAARGDGAKPVAITTDKKNAAGQ
ncbi:MAG: hypothetical protein DLM70_10335 [Chloroflexi bacterium]|nr:MAG: hypothetical protein DLM70_10335 [Chloroflexota bacterium]